MSGSTTVLGLTTVIGNDAVDVPLHFSVGGHQRLEDLLTGGANPAGSLTLAFGTVTADRGLRETVTWNNGAVAFKALTVTAVDTASDAASLLLELRVGAASIFSVRKDGLITNAGGFALGNPPVSIGTSPAGAGSLRLSNNVSIGWRNAADTDDALIELTAADTFRFWINGNIRLWLDPAGNLGLGAPPEAWDSGYRAVQVGSMTIFGAPLANSGGIRQNSWFDGAVNRAILAAPAVDVSLASGVFAVYTMPSVAAGAVQTATERLSISGVSPFISIAAATAATAVAGGQTLPPNPAGFWVVNLNGSPFKIPYYNNA